MTIREFIELTADVHEVYVYNLNNETGYATTADDMDNLDEEVLDAEIVSWDYHMDYDDKGWEKVGTRLCLNYYL